ncbi:MAG: hypothetical protein TQ37_08440 [Candidatus Synechococcus spongiarum 15L]|uniref:Uncharacterized protein n=1 Tax=Candidatus Synechococcus spongiarum 15L TaxID=1608419 RepID=A0A0G8AS94_9SYNE|nr:MAG: hypothetical protein TQ37_08440 [Candidatus Synechococcus spongiarum 15L]
MLTCAPEDGLERSQPQRLCGGPVVNRQGQPKILCPLRVFGQPCSSRPDIQCWRVRQCLNNLGDE